MLLCFIPSTSQYSDYIHQNDTTLISFEPNPSSLANAVLTTKGVCQYGELREVPCSNLSVNNKPSYKPRSAHIYGIYCLEGTVFHFTLINKTATPNISLWLAEADVSQHYLDSLDCSKDIKPGVKCIQLNTTHPSQSIPVWSKGRVGKLYHWRKDILGVNVTINWNFYDISTYDKYKGKKGAGIFPYTVEYHTVFEPAEADPNICVLFHVDILNTDCNINSEMLIEPHLRRDILFWPGLIGILFVLMLLFLVIVQASTYLYKRHKILKEYSPLPD